MTRAEFEALRDQPEKRIEADIRFAEQRPTKPLRVAEDIRIANPDGVDLRLSITCNPRTGSKSINVHVPGVGPICRLEADSRVHPPAGRSHKQGLLNEECPRRNLPDDVADRPDLDGVSVQELFRVFCQMANITHVGAFHSPDEGR